MGKGNLKIKYYCATPEEFQSAVKFDVILNMEIVEHVQDLNLFLNQTSKFLKKNPPKTKAFAFAIK